MNELPITKPADTRKPPGRGLLNISPESSDCLPAYSCAGHRVAWSIRSHAQATPEPVLSRTLSHLQTHTTQTLRKKCRTMSISENLVRRSDARPMRPAQTRKQTMRVIVLVKATNDSEKGILPATDLVVAMGRYNEVMP